MLGTDLRNQVPRLEVPVYFFEGVHDYTCNAALAREYFDGLKAPVKGFYRFDHSAHSPLFEEPDRLRHQLREDVLQGKNLLADGK